jgi:hypothetical protein
MREGDVSRSAKALRGEVGHQVPEFTSDVNA